MITESKLSQRTRLEIAKKKLQRDLEKCENELSQIEERLTNVNPLLKDREELEELDYEAQKKFFADGGKLI